MALSLAPADHGATGPADTATTPPTRAGWRSRVLATLAYLLTLGGLMAVAVTGTESDMSIPINRPDSRVVSGLVSVVEQAMTTGPAPSQP